MNKTTQQIIQINGASGEGGGQILRSSLALSMITGKPFSITNIRANRSKPGLMRQHLTAVNAATAISSAHTLGAELKSTTVSFTPTEVRSGNYNFAVGSAGSAMLILQTILLPLCLADGPSEVVLEGGTHNSFAPPFEFIERAFFAYPSKNGLPD